MDALHPYEFVVEWMCDIQVCWHAWTIDVWFWCRHRFVHVLSRLLENAGHCESCMRPKPINIIKFTQVDSGV